MAQVITVDQLIDTLWNHPENAEWTPKVKAISGTSFREWMKSKDLEVLGFTYNLLGDRRFEMKPGLSLEEYLEFVRRYYARCFAENPDGEWSDSRYSVGWDLVGVITHHWKSGDIPRSVMDEWKRWLGDLYKAGPEELRICIVTATLEHLLEQKAFREFFADWKKDPILKRAYDEALEWYTGGGRTDFWKPATRQRRVKSARKKR